MKVKVHKVSLKKTVDRLLQQNRQNTSSSAWAEDVKRLSTTVLQAIVRRHAHGCVPEMTVEEIYILLEELVHRRETSGAPFKSNEEALADFRRHYVPHEPYDPTIPHELTPSPEGRDCLGNGEWPGYECQCDECPHYLTCFPE